MGTTMKTLKTILFLLVLLAPLTATAQDFGSYTISYSYDDAGRLGQFTFSGSSIAYAWGDGGVLTNRTASTTVDVEPTDTSLPTRYALHDAYPNPFNPSTVLRYDMPSAGRVTVTVFDALGRRVASLLNETVPAGSHALTWQANGLGSGSYFVRMQVGDQVFTQTVVLLR